MPWSRPETVEELIELLKIFPPDHEISFGPFTLYRLKDRGDFVHFEFNEVEGSDYTLTPRDYEETS